MLQGFLQDATTGRNGTGPRALCAPFPTAAREFTRFSKSLPQQTNALKLTPNQGRGAEHEHARQAELGRRPWAPCGVTPPAQARVTPTDWPPLPLPLHHAPRSTVRSSAKTCRPPDSGNSGCFTGTFPRSTDNRGVWGAPRVTVSFSPAPRAGERPPCALPPAGSHQVGVLDSAAEGAHCQGPCTPGPPPSAGPSPNLRSQGSVTGERTQTHVPPQTPRPHERATRACESPPGGCFTRSSGLSKAGAPSRRVPLGRDSHQADTLAVITPLHNSRSTARVCNVALDQLRTGG